MHPGWPYLLIWGSIKGSQERPHPIFYIEKGESVCLHKIELLGTQRILSLKVFKIEKIKVKIDGQYIDIEWIHS